MTLSTNGPETGNIIDLETRRAVRTLNARGQTELGAQIDRALDDLFYAVNRCGEQEQLLKMLRGLTAVLATEVLCSHSNGA